MRIRPRFYASLAASSCILTLAYLAAGQAGKGNYSDYTLGIQAFHVLPTQVNPNKAQIFYNKDSNVALKIDIPDNLKALYNTEHFYFKYKIERTDASMTPINFTQSVLTGVTLLFNDTGGGSGNPTTIAVSEDTTSRKAVFTVTVTPALLWSGNESASSVTGTATIRVLLRTHVGTDFDAGLKDGGGNWQVGPCTDLCQTIAGFTDSNPVPWQTGNDASAATQGFLTPVQNGANGHIQMIRDLRLSNQSEIQTVTIVGGPTGGSFTLTVSNETSAVSQTTSSLAYNSSAATVKAAIEALTTVVGTGNVSVTGSAGGGFSITFTGALAGKNLPQMTANGAGLTGGTTPHVDVATVVDGANFVYGAAVPSAASGKPYVVGISDHFFKDGWKQEDLTALIAHETQHVFQQYLASTAPNTLWGMMITTGDFEKFYELGACISGLNHSYDWDWSLDQFNYFFNSYNTARALYKAETDPALIKAMQNELDDTYNALVKIFPEVKNKNNTGYLPKSTDPD